ncbi:response regulator transcription factor [Bordetella petrii]|uniref:response regulator transcription factor n=1 Tax=Bordetella petrii TaxID=94624 RepID=UPI001A959085|nr:response regulator [Bordetella petrii]MBO1114247.1 response regulator [Bordetella petrii]
MTAPLVLIADDDDLLRDLVQHKLSLRGYTVEQVADGMAAYEFIKARRPALAVLDAMMPDLDGFALLRRLNAEGLLQYTRVIMLTARKLESDIVGAFRAGAADYLQKPFKPEELMSRVVRVVPPESV